MTPDEFRERWTDHGLHEEQAYQDHFRDLCAVAGFTPPTDPDEFCYQKHVTKLGGTPGKADAWLRGRFGWEYKSPGGDLTAAYLQLANYREGLDNPPLLVVSDLDRVQVHTNFSNTTKQVHEFCTASIGEPATLELLRRLFTAPDELNPRYQREEVARQAARRLAELFDSITSHGTDPREVAHTLIRLVFCFFAEDAGLLAPRLLTALLNRPMVKSDVINRQLAKLLNVMITGGDWGHEIIRCFNGGLFDERPPVELKRPEIVLLAKAADLDWSKVEPSIFGSLLEGALSHDKALRSRLGAHYTARDDIELIVEPVVCAPLRAEWAAVAGRCEQLAGGSEGVAVNGAARAQIAAELDAFRRRLGAYRVLDPACGSGNFLYVALVALLNLEQEVRAAGQRWGVTPDLLYRVQPEQLHGIDKDPWAVELARATIWIGYHQWHAEHGLAGVEEPLLRPHETICEADAILNDDGGEPDWPEVDAIIGNPPFLGGKKLRTGLGDDYVDGLFALYDGRVPREADLCCYWYEKARTQIAAGRAKRAGLLATNSIRQGPQMRPVLQRLLDTGGIFMAWSDRDWREDGAAVRVAMVGFDDGTQTEAVLDGKPVERIHADLTSGLDLTQAKRLEANEGIAYMGGIKGGSFEIPGDLAREMLAAPNPLGRDNADVLRPWWNGFDVTRRPRDMWIIDFGSMTEEEAALYEAPFEYVNANVRPVRERNRRASRAARWWIHAEVHPAMRAALAGLPRYIATARVAKHRLFVWVDAHVLCDAQVFVFASAEDYLFGVLHSRVHRPWAFRLGGTLEDRPRYGTGECFDTFPFPTPTPEQREAIGDAARALHEARQSRLDADPKLTLTALYNKRPPWLDNRHRALDRAVLAAYGWPDDLTDDELLERLLALNLARAEDEQRGILVRP